MNIWCFIKRSTDAKRIVEYVLHLCALRAVARKKPIATHHSSLLTILLLPPSPTSLLPPNLHHHHRECYAHAHVHYAHPKTITNITTTINKNQATTNITTAMRARIDGTPPAWSDHNIPSPLKLDPFRSQKKTFQHKQHYQWNFGFAMRMHTPFRGGAICTFNSRLRLYVMSCHVMLCWSTDIHLRSPPQISMSKNWLKSSIGLFDHLFLPSNHNQSDRPSGPSY